MPKNALAHVSPIWFNMIASSTTHLTSQPPSSIIRFPLPPRLLYGWHRVLRSFPVSPSRFRLSKKPHSFYTTRGFLSQLCVLAMRSSPFFLCPSPHALGHPFIYKMSG